MQKWHAFPFFIGKFYSINLIDWLGLKSYLDSEKKAANTNKDKKDNACLVFIAYFCKRKMNLYVSEKNLRQYYILIKFNFYENNT